MPLRTGCRAPDEAHLTRAGTTRAPLHRRGEDHPQGRPCPRTGLSLAWILLVVAGLFEIGWAIGLKYTDGFARPLPSLLTGLSMVASVVLLGLALRTLPVGTAYAVWTGIGTVGTAFLGIVLFGEPAAAVRLACIGLIVLGILGLKLAV